MPLLDHVGMLLTTAVYIVPAVCVGVFVGIVAVAVWDVRRIVLGDDRGDL